MSADSYGWHCPNNEAACLTSSPMTQHCQIIRVIIKIHTTTPNRTVRNNKLNIGILCHCQRGKSPAAAIMHRMTPQKRWPFVTCSCNIPILMRWQLRIEVLIKNI